MDYSVMLERCRRIIGMRSDDNADLIEIVRLLHQYPSGVARHVTAEMLAREMAEFIESEIKVPVPKVKH